MRRFSWQGCCKGDTNSELPFTALCPPVPVSTCDIKSTFLFQVDAFHLRFSPLPLSNVPSLLLSFSVFHWSLLNIYECACVCLYEFVRVEPSDRHFSSVCALYTLHHPVLDALAPVSTTHSTLFHTHTQKKKEKNERRGWKVGILVAMGNFNSILGSILLTRKVALDVWS